MQITILTKTEKKANLTLPLTYIIVMIILVSRPFYSWLYISNLKLCQEDSLTNGRGSRVAGRGSRVAGRVSRERVGKLATSNPHPQQTSAARDHQSNFRDWYSDIAVLGHFCAVRNFSGSSSYRSESLYQLACEEDNKNISPLLEKVGRELFQVSIYVHLCNQLQQATGDRRKANASM